MFLNQISLIPFRFWIPGFLRIRIQIQKNRTNPTIALWQIGKFRRCFSDVWSVIYNNLVIVTILFILYHFMDFIGWLFVKAPRAKSSTTLSNILKDFLTGSTMQFSLLRVLGGWQLVI